MYLSICLFVFISFSLFVYMCFLFVCQIMWDIEVLFSNRAVVVLACKWATCKKRSRNIFLFFSFCSHHITLFQIVEFPHNNIGEVIVNHNMYQRSHETHCSSIISENNTWYILFSCKTCTKIKQEKIFCVFGFNVIFFLDEIELENHKLL